MYNITYTHHTHNVVGMFREQRLCKVINVTPTYSSQFIPVISILYKTFTFFIVIITMIIVYKVDKCSFSRETIEFVATRNDPSKIDSDTESSDSECNANDSISVNVNNRNTGNHHNTDDGDTEFNPNESDTFSDVFNDELSVDDNIPVKCPEFEDVTLYEILPELSAKFDLDSITFSSESVHSLLNALNGSFTISIKNTFNRMNALHSSRLNLTFAKRDPFITGGKKRHNLSLGSLPNITLAEVIVNNEKFYLNLFWLNPPYAQKVPYFKNDMTLVLAAAMNYATLSSNNSLFDFPDKYGEQVKSIEKYDALHILGYASSLQNFALYAEKETTVRK